MPPPEQMYCSQQIKIPSTLPDMLKQFTKGAIRTQPPDILAWSAAYFTALANGETLPVKRRLEQPSKGLTPGMLDLVLQQFKGKLEIDLKSVEKKWKDFGLPPYELDEIVKSYEDLGDTFELMKFAALGANYLAGGNLTEAMRLYCILMTNDPDGGPNRIPLDTFKVAYEFLALMKGEEAEAQVDSVIAFLEEEADRQSGVIMPRNFLHPECPKLS